jgi:hypothetical protein
MIKAVRAKIKLGDIELDVFELPDGDYRLSAKQITDAIGIRHSRVAEICATEQGQSLIHQGIQVADFTKISSDVGNISGYSIQAAMFVWQYEAAKGNTKAFALINACLVETIERRADSAFGVQRSEDERNQRLKARIKGKIERRNLTDWIKHYIDSHDVSDNYKKFIYANCSDAVNQRILGCKAKQARGHYQLGKKDLLRDKVPAKALKEIQFVEEMASRLIDQGVEPLLAVNEALERCYSKTVGL